MGTVIKKALQSKNMEKEIQQYKTLYKAHFMNLSDRDVLLSKLKSIYFKFKKEEKHKSLFYNENISPIDKEAQAIIESYFNSNMLSLFNKKIPYNKPKSKFDSDENFWLSLIDGFNVIFESLKEERIAEWEYKTKFLGILYSCLYNDGLHPNISKRSDEHKRYNLIIEHDFKSDIKTVECIMLISLKTLHSEYLNLHAKELPIRVVGKIVPFDCIYSIQISSTVLLDDEIELYGLKNNFEWNDSNKDNIKFISYCLDETEELLKNPNLIKLSEYVNQSRLVQLRNINTAKFDLSKLIKLCEELNDVSASDSVFATSSLVRAVIDHIPSIFGYINFKTFANEYSNGTKSFKKSMMNLNTSLRNIADNNIHSQVRKKEVLPNKTQVDFSQDLDVLLSEVVRVLE